MNIRDIARLANVTPSTVSKVLNNYSDISEATRQHVLRIIEENQYSPKANAKSGSLRLGLVVESVYNSLYSTIEDVLSVNLYNAGYSITSFHDNFYSQDKHEKFVELRTQAERNKLKGLIYIGGNFETLTPEEINTLPCPTVFVNTVLPQNAEHANYSSIQVSHFETAWNQMHYLISKGHKDIITVISSQRDISVYGQRVRGYRAALNEAGLAQNLPLFLESDYLNEKAYAAVLGCLMEHPQITAICSVADIIVPGILRAIYDAGKTPGKDVEVISFDGLDVTEYGIPSVSTFAQPILEITGFVENLLVGIIKREREHQHITFRPKFLKRESC